MSMRAGGLRERVEIRRKEKIPDGMGGFDEVETSLFSCWAAVVVPRSKEGIVSGRDLELRTHEVTIRHRFNVDQEPKHGDRVMWKSQGLRVATVRPIGSGAGYVLECVLEV